MKHYQPPILPAPHCYCASLPHQCDFCNGMRAVAAFPSREARDSMAAWLLLAGFREGRSVNLVPARGLPRSAQDEFSSPDFRCFGETEIEASIPRTVAAVMATIEEWRDE